MAEALSHRLWRKQYFIPTEHGAWIWWIGPFLIGLSAGGHPGPDVAILFVAALAAFLLRQPATIAVKSLSGRRPRADLTPGILWLVAYGTVAILAGALLIARGHNELLWLALAGAPVFALHLWQVSRRKERGQMGVELIATGVLALAAPAAYWVSAGLDSRTAWLLWGMTWLQSAASIVFVYLRLEQRLLKAAPPCAVRWHRGGWILAWHAFNLAASLTLAVARLVPRLVAMAYALMLTDAVQSIALPPVGARPAAIGLRQLAASAVFVVTMILAYRLG